LYQLRRPTITPAGHVGQDDLRDVLRRSAKLNFQLVVGFDRCPWRGLSMVNLSQEIGDCEAGESSDSTVTPPFSLRFYCTRSRHGTPETKFPQRPLDQASNNAGD
jgi:hypothetical protein